MEPKNVCALLALHGFGFVDDLFRILSVFNQSTVFARQLGLADSDTLVRCAAEKGYALNTSKQETATHMRSRASNRAPQTVPSTEQGKWPSQLIYLGAIFSPTGACAGEVARRIAFANRSCSNLYGFWTSAAPRGTKRLVLHINVYTRLLSGLEAFCLGVIDLCRLSVAMGKNLGFWSKAPLTKSPREAPSRQ